MNGERVRSLPYQLRAAAAARAVYGFTQAAGFLARAAEAAGEAGDAAAAAEARFAEAEALAAAGSYQRALEALEKLLERAPLIPLALPLALRCHLRDDARSEHGPGFEVMNLRGHVEYSEL